MAVVGSRTASLATLSYVAPFQTVSSAPAAPITTGSITASVTGNPVSVPTAADGLTDLQFVAAYLKARELSEPSMRYMYLFWIILAGFGILYSLAFHLRLSAGWLGTRYSRWGIRKRTVGGKIGVKARSLPSNNSLLVMAGITILVAALAAIGPDYIRPSAPIFDFVNVKRDGFIIAPVDTIQKSFWTSGNRFGDSAFALMPLVVLLAIRTAPFNILSIKWFMHLCADKMIPIHRYAGWLIWGITTIHVVLWTINVFIDQRNGRAMWFIMFKSYRFCFGCTAYASMTCVMVLSLKRIRQTRFEVFYIGHLIFVPLTIIASAVHHPQIWWWMAIAGSLWAGERLTRYIRFARINGVWGGRIKAPVVGGRRYDDLSWPEQQAPPDEYGMTEIKNPFTYPQPGPESIDFSAKQGEYGGYGGYGGNTDKTLPRAPSDGRHFPAPSHGRHNPPTQQYSSSQHQQQYPSSHAQPAHRPYASHQQDDQAGGYYDQHNDFGRSMSGYYDEGSLQPLGSYDSRNGGHEEKYSTYAPPMRRNQGGSGSGSGSGTPLYDPGFPVQPSRIRGGGPGGEAVHAPGNIPIIPVSDPDMPLQIPKGFALAQLLPSRTIRLTIRPVRNFKWAPGQYAMATFPELSWLQGHPFTIANTGGGDVVLIIKARKGMTKRLFNLVRKRTLASVGLDGTNRHLDLETLKGGEGHNINVPPVYIKTWVDGPIGSASRVRWQDYSTVVMIVGGSGVTFGMAVTEYICKVLSAGNLKKNWKTQRVRFCWVVREYAEISWIAQQLAKIRELVTASQLEISIFVTRGKAQRNELAPPSMPWAGSGGRNGSTDSLGSVASHMSRDPLVDGDELVDTHLQENFLDVVDLTNFEDEEDIMSPSENKLSDKLQQEGKLRRAKTKKAQTIVLKMPSKKPGGLQLPGAARGSRLNPGFEGEGAGSSGYAAYSTPAPAASGYESDHDYEVDHRLARPAHGRIASHGSEVSLQVPHAPSFHAGNKRMSSHSLADSAYGRYDPFSNTAHFGAPSLAPSIYTEDNRSLLGESLHRPVSSMSNSHSMVLLEQGSVDPNDDAALWLDENDYNAMKDLSEMARAGKPKLASVLEEEIQQSQGRIIVGTCGPSTLNTVVRKLVASHIAPGRVRHGDKTGHIELYSEDFEA